MRTIAGGQEDIIKLWGHKISQDKQYRLLRYHVLEDCDEGKLLLNIVTGELILLDSNEEKIVENLPMSYKHDMDELIAHNFLVPEDFDDVKSVNQLRQLLRRIATDKDIVSYTILPTSACNARCFYCFEEGYPCHSMTSEVADRVAEYIVNHSSKGKTINLRWFGGEPMLCVDRIDQICYQLTEQGIDYISTMVSNGYLFSEEVARHAKERWNLKKVQITLDGTEETYNKTKAYLGNHSISPYYRVLDNIEALLAVGVRVDIRLNLGFHNAYDLYRLTDYLAERFSPKAGFAVYVHELYENCGKSYRIHSDQEMLELFETKYALEDYLEKKKCKGLTRDILKRPLPRLRYNYCMADNEKSLVVNPLGQFSRCEHDLFTRIIGDIYTEHSFRGPEAEYWYDTSYKKQCESCAFFPYCGLIEACEAANDCPLPQKQNMIKTVSRQIGYQMSSYIQNRKEGSI